MAKTDMSQIETRTWDYIVVGTGMGGGSFGLQVAQAGYSVLFIEKGYSPNSPNAVKGKFAELAVHDQKDRDEVLRRGGRSTDPFIDVSGRRPKPLTPFIGSSVGGSSAIYGAVLERFQASDLESWPISGEVLAPFYESAEVLFRVRRSETFDHPGNRALANDLRRAGLNPYALPIATDHSERCGSCQGYLCKDNCKNDAFKICVQPAVEKFGAALLTECEAREIRVQDTSATGVVVVYRGSRHFIRAKRVVLAAGALASPLLLQESRSGAFPEGIGNHHGLVGRYLMRHFVDLFALKIDSAPENPMAKEIGMNDFYIVDGKKLGTVQSFGRLPPLDVILDQMGRQFFSKILFRMIRPIFRPVLKRVLAGRLVMASIIEDEPRYENRVWRENGAVRIQYWISAGDRMKIEWLRKKLTQVFKPFSTMFIASAEKNEMLAHACGTCRMGVDPKTSVVDMENKVHGTENVYVVDSSFFPTSGGTNPALTIAANAIRVAELLVYRDMNTSVTGETLGKRQKTTGGLRAS